MILLASPTLVQIMIYICKESWSHADGMQQLGYGLYSCFVKYMTPKSRIIIISIINCLCCPNLHFQNTCWSKEHNTFSESSNALALASSLTVWLVDSIMVSNSFLMVRYAHSLSVKLVMSVLRSWFSVRCNTIHKALDFTGAVGHYANDNCQWYCNFSFLATV